MLLGLLSALSLVIVASALSRMYTYQKVYSFTGERIFVMAFELLLGAVFVHDPGGRDPLAGRLDPGATVGLAVVMLLGLAVLNPEDYAARRNIARYEETGKIDAWYLRALSADATPALADAARPGTPLHAELDRRRPGGAGPLVRLEPRPGPGPRRPGPARAGRHRRAEGLPAADQFDLPKTRSHPR